MNINGWCPIISYEDGEDKIKKKCIEDQCAWWDNEKSCCIVFSIHQGIQKITSCESYDLGDVCSDISSVSSDICDVNRKMDNL